MHKTFHPTVRLVRKRTRSLLTVQLPKVEYEVKEIKGKIQDSDAEQSILKDMLSQLYPGWTRVH